MKDITIVVATHKSYPMPKDDMYLPLQVGAEGKPDLGFMRDNTGDHISLKNAGFSELTGLYWAWKNLDSDYIGLVHYRRYFKGKQRGKGKFDTILKREELESYLDEYPIIVVNKRRYYIETIESHYRHTLEEETLDETIHILHKKYPEYEKSFQKVLHRSYMHAFNMMIMRKDYLNDYCEWLFDILFELEKNMQHVTYDEFHARFCARISEILLDVWLEYHGLKYQEVPFMYMGKVNRLKKGTAFLRAKFLGEKYKKSF